MYPGRISAETKCILRCNRLYHIFLVLHLCCILFVLYYICVVFHLCNISFVLYFICVVFHLCSISFGDKQCHVQSAEVNEA